MDFLNPSTPCTPCTPLIIKDYSFGFDGKSDIQSEDKVPTPEFREIIVSPNLTPKLMLLSPAISPLQSAASPTIINGRLAPQQFYSKTPQRRGSPLANLRRLRSPRKSPDIRHHRSIRLEVPLHSNLVAGNKNKNTTSKEESKSNNLAARRKRRQLRLKELQEIKELQSRYAVPFEIEAVRKPLSPRVDFLLKRVGMIRYRSIFQIEEVDFLVFRTLTKNDLQALGVENADDREEIYNAVLLADMLILERFQV